MMEKLKSLHSKKFYVVLIVVFLAFLAIGKYTQTNALTSSSVVYATTVKDKKTGKQIHYQVQRVGKNRYKITNANTGQTYTGRIQTEADKSISMALPNGNGVFNLKNKGTFVPDAQLTLKDSKNLEQVSSKTIPAANASFNQAKTAVKSSTSSTSKSLASSQSSSTSSTTSKTTETTSESSTETKTETSSTNTSSTKTSSTTSSSTKSSQSEVDLIASLDQATIKKLTADFSKWLYESSYGKYAVVVKGRPNEPVHTANSGNGDVASYSVETADGKMLATVSGLDESQDLSTAKISSYTVDDKHNATKEEFVSSLSSSKIAALGIVPTSTKASDLINGNAVRVYHLKDNSTHYYEEFSDEAEAVKTAVKKEAGDSSDDALSKESHYGYDYYYDKLVDTSKPSYEFILANNGKVYMAENYKPAAKSYKEAPKDIQQKYTELIQKYTEQESKTESTATSESSIFPEEALGTWYGSSKQTDSIQMTIEKDGTVKTISNFKADWGGTVESKATVRKVEKVRDSIYRFVDYTGEHSAINPGVTGIGGAGFKTADGFKLENGTYKYVYWTVAEDEEFDFTEEPKDFDVTLSKDKGAGSSQSSELKTKGTVRVVVSDLKVREAPSTSSKAVASYNNGDTIDYDDVQTNEGYVWVSYIAPQSKQRRYVAIKEENGATFAENINN